MNNINERITKVKNYFVSFNITDGVVYIAAKIPVKWTMPNKIGDVMTATDYNKEEPIVYFYAKNVEPDTVFDALEEVIDINKSIEEKKLLLKEKADELSTIFASEPIERLRTLKFTMDDDCTSKTVKGKRKRTTRKVKKNTREGSDNTVNTEISGETENNKESLLSFATELVEGNR